MRIVATIKAGPEALSRVQWLSDAGIKAFRVNFARKSIDANTLLLRELEEMRSSGRIDQVFVDLPGRKARLAPIRDKRRLLEEGAQIRLSPYSDVDEQTRLEILNPWVLAVAKKNDLISVGEAVLTVQATHVSDGVDALVSRAGVIYNLCAVHVSTDRYLPSKELTELDLAALDAGGWGADFLGLSFADHPNLVKQAARLREASTRSAALVAKVESPVGAQNLYKTGSVADGLMLCRGDLSYFFDLIEMDQLAFIMVKVAREFGLVVILASDYFKSLMTAGKRGQPSRDERRRLTWAQEHEVDYLVLNETATSPNWQHIGSTAMRYQENGGGPSEKEH